MKIQNIETSPKSELLAHFGGAAWQINPEQLVASCQRWKKGP